LPIPEDDDCEREGAEEIAEIIGKTPQATAVLLSRRRAGPAYKFAGKWRMRPSDWHRWRQQQIDAVLAKGAERNDEPIQVRAHQVKAHQRRRGWRGSSGAAEPVALTAAAAKRD
jgi:hypothetical protein